MSKRTVSDTSKAAYESIKGEMQQNHYTKIIAALKDVECAIYEDIATITGLEKHKIGRRLSELELAGKVYKTGIKKPTSTGRQAYAYSLTGNGLPKAQEKPKVTRQKKEVPPNTTTVREHKRNLNKKQQTNNNYLF